ncbi:MAG: hypothetical protein EP344_18180 [Bacteroidetes bacterium]|nr:MAG: hypothetical protein EP344_18180 [Bacteroidota bacterium]
MSPRIFFPVFLLLGLVGSTDLPGQKNQNGGTGMLPPEAVSQLHTSEDTLVILSYAVVNDSLPEMRFLACRSLIKALVRALKVENSFHYPFNRLKSVSILAPPDSSFRIFTWQLFVDDSTYRYYGAIQMNRPELQLYPLVDRSFEFRSMPTREELTPDQWYGALYYNILPLETKKEQRYLLFGYDGFSFFDKRKVLEVLTFAPDGTPQFGAPMFNRPDEGEEYRLILEYFAEANVRLNWDEHYQMILFDHLIPYTNPYTGGVMYVPDGSYSAFKVDKGRLRYVDKVFDEVLEEAPRPEPVLDKEKGNNILGTKGKPKKEKN